jgi:hypothetical protein
MARPGGRGVSSSSVEKFDQLPAPNADRLDCFRECALGFDRDVDREFERKPGGRGPLSHTAPNGYVGQYVDQLGQLARSLRLRLQRERRRVERNRVVLRRGDDAEVAGSFYG